MFAAACVTALLMVHVGAQSGLVSVISPCCEWPGGNCLACAQTLCNRCKQGSSAPGHSCRVTCWGALHLKAWISAGIVKAASLAGSLPDKWPTTMLRQASADSLCLQIEAAVQDAGPPDVRSMLSCLAAFAASGQLAARLAASAKARATHSAPESHPSEPPMLIMDPDTDPDLEFDLDFGPDSDLEGDLELSEDSSPAQLHSQAQEDPPGTRQPSGGVRGLPPWMLSASSSGSQQAQHHPQPPQQQGQQLQEPAVLAAVARAGCVR